MGYSEEQHGHRLKSFMCLFAWKRGTLFPFCLVLESVFFIHQVNSVVPSPDIRYAVNAAEPSGQYPKDLSVSNDEHVKTCLGVQVCLYMLDM